MSSQSSAGETPGSGQMEPVPQAITWLRACVGGAACIGGVGAAIHGLAIAAQGCMYPLEGVVWVFWGAVSLLLVGLPSLAIASALSRSPDRGVRRALIHDAIVVVPITLLLAVWSRGFLVSGSRDPFAEVCLASVGTAVALVFGVEAAWLLYRCRGRKSAWMELGLLAAVLVLLSVALPITSYYRQLAHVRPLMQYVDSHFVALPGDTRISVTRWPGARGGHRDVIWFTVGEAKWHVAAAHVPSGGWRLPAGADQEDPVGAVGPSPRAKSAAQALGYLRRIGAVDGGIRLVGRAKARSGLEAYVFRSPRAGGSYYVTEHGDVSLRLQRPAVVPDRPR